MILSSYFSSAPLLVKPSVVGFLAGKFMSDGDNQHPERELRERIARLMQSVGATGKQVSEQERQELKSAAIRLNQLLQSTADADQQALKTAAGRLDQLLSDIRTGKDVTQALKRKSEQQTRRE
jgi:ParB-like chromosome segregation protein Spo0J